MLYFTCQRADEYFRTKPAELLTLVTFCATFVILFATIYGNALALHAPMVMSLVYTLCKLDPDTMVSIWGFPV